MSLTKIAAETDRTVLAFKSTTVNKWRAAQSSSTDLIALPDQTTDYWGHPGWL